MSLRRWCFLFALILFLFLICLIYLIGWPKIRQNEIILFGIWFFFNIFLFCISVFFFAAVFLFVRNCSCLCFAFCNASDADVDDRSPGRHSGQRRQTVADGAWRVCAACGQGTSNAFASLVHDCQTPKQLWGHCSYDALSLLSYD